MTKSEKPANYGIIGDVTAKAVAVGTKSKAVVHEGGAPSRAQFDAAIEALRAQIDALQVAQSGQQVLHDDVTKIEKLASEKPQHEAAASGVLAGLVDKFKMIGVVAKTAVGLAGPLKVVAAWFGIPLPF